MRNLKRALSLTLASVMLLGMMVVGSSAAGYPDVAEDDNVEAIEVVQSVGVMVGDENGNFRPADTVSRAEMAVVMGKLLNLDYNYYEAICPFTDVAGVYDWARGWVGAAAANGIVSGRGDGIYDPGATVTAVEAASMMMRALGYFKYQNDYADGFEVSTVRQGTTIGIFDGVGSSATAPMTRNQVAQMVLNALQTGMVEPDGNTTTFLNPDGTVLATTGKVNYVSVTSDKLFASAISTTRATSVGSYNDGWIVELGEQLYNGDLKLYEYADDDYMRPARTWEFDGKTVGTYMKKENIRAEYTDGVNRRELYDLLGRSSLNDYDFHYYVDGVESDDITAADILTRTTKDYGTTGRGVLTQVFVDTQAETIDITSINTWLAKAASDYNDTRESVVLNVYNNYTSNKTTTISKTVSKIDVPEAEEVVKDEYVLVNWSGKDQPSGTYEVVEIAPVEILSNSTLTKFSKGDDSDPLSDKTGHEAIFSSVTTNGTEYKNSKKAYYSDEALDLYNNNLLTNKTYNIYLDKYGYAIGVDLYAGDDNYVFISGIKLNNSTIAVTQADVNAIFTDGTCGTIKVNVKDTDKNIETVQRGSLNGKAYFEKWTSNYYDTDPEKAVVNRWYTYTVDKDGVYTLTPAARMLTSRLSEAETIKCDNVVLDRTSPDGSDTSPHATVAERIYGNDKSIYIIPELDNVSGEDVSDKVITGVDGLYTGVQDVEIDIAYAADDGDKLVLGSDTTELYDSVYAVYDKNNYVIAAVIVGEAKGTSANYAYILSAAKSEGVIDDTYYWEFDAVIDGEKQTLTVKSKFANTINSLLPGHVQELRYTDEYVTAIKNIGVSKFYTDPSTAIDRNAHEVYEVGHVRHFSECPSSTDCAITDYTYPTSSRLTVPDLHVEYRTLKLGLDSTLDYGLALVSDNTPAVVIQYEDGSKETRYYTSVAAALSTLGDADGDDANGKLGFVGRITAVLNSQGVAKWVVINSDTPVNRKAGTVTGTTCNIVIQRVLNASGIEDKLEPITQKVSTSELVTVNGARVWIVNAPVVPGWKPVSASKTVSYVAGQSSYPIEFAYGPTGNTASTMTTPSASVTVDPGTGLSVGSVTMSGTNVKVPITSKNSTFQDGDTIQVTAGTPAAGATVDPGTIDLVYSNGAWSTGEFVVTAEDGTSTTYNVSVDLDDETAPTVTANASADGGNTGNGTATAALSGTNINVKIVTGSTDFATGDKFTVTVAAAAKGTLTDKDGNPVTTIALEKKADGWVATPDKVIGTAQDGSSETYTVAITTGLSSTVSFTATAATRTDDNSNITIATGSTSTTAPVAPAKGKIEVNVTSAYSTFDNNDSILVEITGTNGCTVDTELVLLTFTGKSATAVGTWSTKDIVVTAPDGTTKETYTVSVKLDNSTEATVGASTSVTALGNVTAALDATAKTITVSFDGTAAAGTITVSISVTAPVAVDNSSVTITGTDDGGGTITWESNHSTVTVTAQDGTEVEYTIVTP